MKRIRDKKRSFRRWVDKLPGLFAYFETLSHTVFQDSSGTTPATTADPVRCWKDVRWKNGVNKNFTKASGNVPDLSELNPGQDVLLFTSASSQLADDGSDGTGMAGVARNVSGLTIIQVTTVPSSGGGTKRGIFISRNASNSVRAGSNVVAGEAFQIQSRSLDADGAQTSGSVATFTPGDTVVRIDVFDYANTKQRTYIDGTLVIDATPTWGATSTSDTDSTEVYLSGQNGSLYYIDGGYGLIIFLQAALPTSMIDTVTKIVRDRWALA